MSHNTQFIESFNVNYIVRINSFILLDCTKEEYQFKCISVSFIFLFSCWFWLKSVLTLEVMVYIPAADMSLANPKSPTLATKLASTKIFLAAKSRWTNCERRQCIIFSLETLNDWVAYTKVWKILIVSWRQFTNWDCLRYKYLLNRGSRMIGWPKPKCQRSPICL